MSSARFAFAISAGATPLVYKGREQAVQGIYVGGAGNITITDMEGNSVQFTNVPVGVLPVCATHVTAATATGLVGLVK